MSQIPIAQLCHIRLPLADFEAGKKFASELLGFEPVVVSDVEIGFRSDERYQTLSFIQSHEPAAIGIELPDAAAMDAAAEAFDRLEIDYREADRQECARRFVRRCLIARDGTGNAIELVLRPSYSARKFFPSRDTGISRFHSIGIRSTNLQDDIRFWTEVLNAEVSDWVGDITYLRIDDTHHRIALYPAASRGVLYVTYEAESLDAVMQNDYLLLEKGVKVLHGPGLEAASNQTFLRFSGPGDYIFALGHGMSMDMDKPRRPRQFVLEPEALCAWGSPCLIEEMIVSGGKND